jgi:dCTP deaminase
LPTDSLFPTQQPGGEGILPSQEIRALIENGKISSSADIRDDQIQPSSIDLRLFDEAYRVRASFLPGKSTTLLRKATSNGMLTSTLDISNPTLLERGVIYIIPLMESLDLPADVHGIANPKSSTGRLDVFTRLITESGDEFERVRRGYSGRLYIEVLSQTFPIIVQAGMTLNQLRFGRGRLDAAGDSRLKQLEEHNTLLDVDEDSGQSSIDRGLRITVDLQGNSSGIVAYQANKTSPPIDLSKINFYEAFDFWTPIYRNEKLQFVLEPGEFYILASKQRVRVSPDFAAEMLPYDLATQEFRVHYAGFFDPGFGYGVQGEIPGTRAVLEVRASQMPILLEDDQFVGRLNYYKMSATPDKVYGGRIGSCYQQQGLTLSKQFKRDGQHVSSSGTNPIPGTSPAKAKTDEEDEELIPGLVFPITCAEHRINAKGDPGDSA